MKKIICILIYILYLNLVSAVISIDINIPSSFTTGEIISFRYTLISDTNQKIVFTPYSFCQNTPVSFLQQNTISLIAGQPYTNTYTDITITEDIEPQTCTAYVQIISPIPQIASKNFSIVTNPSFDFSIKTCKDSACIQKSKIFIKNENIYLNYDSSVAQPSITAKLTYPDKSQKSINLPTTIKAEQIGTYTLDVTATKQGYKEMTLKEQVGVIEGEASIQTAQEQEQVGEQPTTELKTTAGEKGKVFWIIFSVIIGLIAIAIVILIVYLIKRRSKL